MNDLKKGQAALLKNQRISDSRTVDSFKKTLTKKVFLIGCVCLFLGNFIGGAWVTYHGPNIPLVWSDGWGEQGYLELAAQSQTDVAELELKTETLKLIHSREAAEKGKVKRQTRIKKELDIKTLDSHNKSQIELAGKIAVLESQNEWLWRSHHRFIALLEDDDVALAKYFPRYLEIATKKRLAKFVEIILAGQHPNLANYLMDNYPKLAWPDSRPDVGNNP